MPLSFPRLFNLSPSKHLYIRDMYSIMDGSFHWNLAWKRPVRGRALSDQIELRNLLAGITPNQSEMDHRIWIHDKANGYTSSAAYQLMQPDLRLIDNISCNRLWNKLIPSKVSVFGWRLLLNRLPTKDQLLLRGSIDPSQSSCSLCAKDFSKPSFLLVLQIKARMAIYHALVEHSYCTTKHNSRDKSYFRFQNSKHNSL